jgi:hypothetical protein
MSAQASKWPSRLSTKPKLNRRRWTTKFDAKYST